MRPSRLHSRDGSVLLVALCFVTVLGISLASYIAVCSRTMQISNRSAQTDLSNQLAEMGLEEAMRAFNKNDWSDWTNSNISVDWTLDTTNKRATASVTLPAAMFGQGVTGSVKIRVDNYDAPQLGVTWSSSRSYRVNDLVGYNGMWYRCVQNHSNQTPSTTTNLGYWVPAPIPWTWSTNLTYALYDIVNYNGAWYRYINASATSGNAVSNTTYWVQISSPALAWSSGTAYSRGAVVYSNGTWYYCHRAHTSGTIVITDTLYWGAIPVPTVDTWDVPASSSYVVGDYVYRSGLWYRCILAHTSSNALRPEGPSGSTYWASGSIPYISWIWRSGASYKFNDVVYYGTTGAGTWYRCKTASVASTTAPAADSTNWENALSGTNTTSTPGPLGWSSSVNYNLNDTVYYSGSFYRCILAHAASQTPATGSAYWANTPRLSNTWDPGRAYSSNDTVYYNGVWYLSQTSSSNYGQNPATATSYWSPTTSNQWNVATAYSVGSHRGYGGVWYRCITANTGQSPNNPTYWTPTWSQSAGATSGAPVVYAEGTINLAGTASITTQLRAAIAPAPLFPNAAAATTTITASGGGTVDSYDGTVLSMSVGGIYSSYAYGSPNITYSAVVAAGATSGTAITLSSTAVKGYLAAASASSSPYAPLVSSGGTVKGSSSPATPNIDLTHISRSPSIPSFDTLPTGGLTTNWSTAPKGEPLPSSATINVGTPGSTVPARYYYDGNLVMGGGSSIIATLNINGPVILFINGDLTMTGTPNGIINLSNTASAEIHFAGGLKANSASDGIKNNTADPKTLILICDNSSTTTQYYSEGANSLYGVVYMPKTTATNGLYFNYTDTNSTTLYGAVSAAKLSYQNNMNIHYDTSLRYATFGGIDQPYGITEWRQLTDPAELATMP
jgi:hypothetical protein